MKVCVSFKAIVYNGRVYSKAKPYYALYYYPIT